MALDLTFKHIDFGRAHTNEQPLFLCILAVCLCPLLLCYLPVFDTFSSQLCYDISLSNFG